MCCFGKKVWEPLDYCSYIIKYIFEKVSIKIDTEYVIITKRT